ncbi:MAG: T9SS type A sorting domain-containing protein [Bacteroidetes bacterium]|nr:T9SS type A sorting domain-containing protein [Bacteroidota bacterium]
MKKLIYTIFFLSIFISAVSFSQIPSYTLEVKNGNFVNANTFTFDIVFTHTDANVWETASWQYFFRVDNAFFGGGTVTYAYDSSGGDAISDLPVAFRPRNPQSVVQTTYRELRLPANSLPGTGNGLIVPQGVPTLIGRMKVTSTNPLVFASLSFIIRDSCESPISINRTKINIYDQSDLLNKEVTRCANHSVNLNFPPPIIPIANFYSNIQIINSGQSVNFSDSSLNSPTNWSWTFQGGTPSVSTQKNPAGIFYNTPGIFGVTLIASNSAGSDTITKSGYITVNPYCPFTWQSFIKASDAGNNKDSIKFGMSPFATDLLDTCLGESIIPPPPPAGAFDQRFVLSTNDGVRTDFRNDTVMMRKWKMNFQPSTSGYPFTFTWKNSDFPTDGSFFLKDPSGIIVNINMRNQNSYVLTNSAINSLNIEYEYNTTKEISVNSGWNMISIPISLSDMNPSVIFPGAASPAYYYNNGYVSTNVLQISKGYWVKFNNPGSYFVTGIPLSPKNINVVSSWNIIGPFDENIPVNNIVTVPSGLLSSNFFEYNDAYYIEDTLKAGKGYWIKSNANGYIKNGTGDNVVMNTHIDYNTLITFDFSDANGRSAKLFLTGESGNIQNSDLPPVPPAGVFDVRFSSDKFIESVNQNQIVRINSAEMPFKLKVTNLNGAKIRVKDNVTGNLLNKELTDNDEIIINSPLDNFTVINESQIPESYGLSQNFPNPFNPSTTIKYQIPEDGKVNIVIFDVLGRELMTLVDKVQNAGKYEMEFNAGDLSSGIYFYRLISGDFSDLKRMVLLK